MERRFILKIISKHHHNEVEAPAETQSAERVRTSGGSDMGCGLARIQTRHTLSEYGSAASHTANDAVP